MPYFMYVKSTHICENWKWNLCVCFVFFSPVVYPSHFPLYVIHFFSVWALYILWLYLHNVIFYMYHLCVLPPPLSLYLIPAITTVSWLILWLFFLHVRLWHWLGDPYVDDIVIHICGSQVWYDKTNKKNGWHISYNSNFVKVREKKWRKYFILLDHVPVIIQAEWNFDIFSMHFSFI